MAEKDKDRAATERAQVKAPAAAAKTPLKPRAKTAYQVTFIPTAETYPSEAVIGYFLCRNSISWVAWMIFALSLACL